MEVTIWGLNLVVRKGSVLVVPKPLEGRIEVIFRDLNLRQAGRFLVVSEHLEIRIEVIFERWILRKAGISVVSWASWRKFRGKIWGVNLTVRKAGVLVAIGHLEGRAEIMFRGLNLAHGGGFGGNWASWRNNQGKVWGLNLTLVGRFDGVQASSGLTDSSFHVSGDFEF